MPRPKAIDAKIEKRRAYVATALLAGKSYRQIVDDYSVDPNGDGTISLGTVASDAKAVMREWRKETAETVELLAAQQNARLNTALSAIWTEVLAGDFDAVDRLIKIENRRASLLGLDKPAKVAQTDPTGTKAAALPHVVFNIAPETSPDP